MRRPELLAAMATTTSPTQATFTIPEPPSTIPPVTVPGVPTSTSPSDAAPISRIKVGAASRSVLPTVAGNRDYLGYAPGWNDINPNSPGVFLARWDQGVVDVGNGSSDGSWVHDDLRATAVAIQGVDETVVIVSIDVYMVFAADAAEIERRARAILGAAATDDLRIIVSATHNHHGPDTAFSINDDWYSLMADETAAAVAEAVTALQPARLVVASGIHRFGMADARDPLIVDPRLNTLQAIDAVTGSTIATVVQWASHPETTLNWSPPGRFSTECAQKGWSGEGCTAEGRYFSADYPGVLRTRLQAQFGGEVAYLNGAIGSQIGPGEADIWRIDEAHPLGDGIAAPPSALPVGGTKNFRDKNFARTQTIGDQLAAAVTSLILDEGEPMITDGPEWAEQSFFTPLNNIGFRVLLADGTLGWQDPTVYSCGPRPYADATCASDGGLLVDDPVLTPLADSQIRVGDVVKTRLVHIDFGDVGFLFLPGELPPELVVGLPADFADNSAAYYTEPDLHAAPADYAMPPSLLELASDEITFTVGLGGDELGYWVPIDDVRLKCLDVIFSDGMTCLQLFDAGYLITPDAAAGPRCKELADTPSLLTQEDAAQPLRVALSQVCRYGAALGRELGEPSGHYEETNSAGWDLVSDLAAAAEVLLGS
jgi:hypothetical protein